MAMSGGGGVSDRLKRSQVESGALDETIVISGSASPSKSPPDTDTDTTADYESAGEPEDTEDVLNKTEHCISSLASRLEDCHLSTPKLYQASGFPFNSPGLSDLNNSCVNVTAEFPNSPKSLPLVQEAPTDSNSLTPVATAQDNSLFLQPIEPSVKVLKVGDNTFTEAPINFNTSTDSVATDSNDSVETLCEVNATNSVDPNYSVSFSDRTNDDFENFSRLPNAESTQSNIQVDSPFENDSFNLSSAAVVDRKHYNSPAQADEISTIYSNNSQSPALNVALINSTLESLLQDSLSISLSKNSIDPRNKTGEAHSIHSNETPVQSKDHNVIIDQVPTLLNKCDTVVDNQNRLPGVSNLVSTNSSDEVENIPPVCESSVAINQERKDQEVLNLGKEPDILLEQEQNDKKLSELDHNKVVDEEKVVELKNLESAESVDNINEDSTNALEAPVKTTGKETGLLNHTFETLSSSPVTSPICVTINCLEKLSPADIRDEQDELSESQIPDLEPVGVGDISNHNSVVDEEPEKQEIVNGLQCLNHVAIEEFSESVSESDGSHVEKESTDVPPFRTLAESSRDSRPIVVTSLCFERVESSESIQKSPNREPAKTDPGVPGEPEKETTLENTPSKTEIKCCDLKSSVINVQEQVQEGKVDVPTVVEPSVEVVEVDQVPDNLKPNLDDQSDTSKTKDQVIFKVPFVKEPSPSTVKCDSDLSSAMEHVPSQVPSMLQPLSQVSKMCDNTFSYGSSGPLSDMSYEGATSVKWSMIEEDCIRESSLIGVSLSEIQEGTQESLTESNKSYKDMSELIATCSQQERDLASPNFEVSFREEAERLAQHVLTSTSDDKHKMQPDPSADINKSEAGPITADEDFNNGELFQEAAGFDFDYLSKVGSGHSKSSVLSRQSLYVKFDPLVGSIVSSTESPSHPSVNSAAVTRRDMADEKSGENVTKVEVSPAPEEPSEETNNDKLINITPVKSKHETTPTAKVAPTTPSTLKNKPSSVTPNQLTPRQDILSREISKLQDLMIQQEQSFQEQLIEKTELVEKLKKRVTELESREPRDDLEAKLKASEAKVAKLKKEVSEYTFNKKQLTVIMEEYEKTIAQLITKSGDYKKQAEAEKEAIASERDTALQHLNNMEVAFNDIHAKYERCKGVIETLKNNETQLKACSAENEKTIRKQESDYQKLKKHASEKLEAANDELAALKKVHQSEIAKMKAITKKYEIRIKSLEEALEQKNKEVRELTQICDDLIGKVESQ